MATVANVEYKADNSSLTMADAAAMQCVVEGAGGIFRQMDGTLMIYNRVNTLNDKGFFIVNREENIWI